MMGRDNKRVARTARPVLSEGGGAPRSGALRQVCALVLLLAGVLASCLSVHAERIASPER